MNSFKAQGKLLLTGEYLVLKGAVALALPTKLGQTMTVESSSETSLCWNAYKPDGPWFSVTLNAKTLEIIETDDQSKAEKLVQILKAVQALNPNAIVPGLCFETRLEFNTEWGLGSSSTLLSLLAQWAGVNPYTLLKMTIDGSGYDIACATANSAIHYKLDQGEPKVHPVVFNPPFTDRLFFVYQGKKQHSSEEVKAFNKHWENVDLTNEMQIISELSMALPTVTYFEDFRTLLQVHESIISSCLNREPVQKQFLDFDGVLKSLGAWGGDFIMAATEQPYEQVAAYFKKHGLDTVFHYHDIIL
jgi:mevalonate kinase